MNDAFTNAIRAMDKEAFQSLYGRREALTPAEVAELLAPTGIRWWIAGGRAARVGVADRHHVDTDVAIRIGDLDQLRERLSDWDLWEANDGAPATAAGAGPVLPGWA